MTYPVDPKYRELLVRQRGPESNVVSMYDESHPPEGAEGHQGFVTEKISEARPSLPDAVAIEKKGRNAEHGRLLKPLDHEAARGTKGSAIAADGREHLRGFPCPADNMFLSADRRMWCPIVNYDLKAVGRILDSAFGTRR